MFLNYKETAINTDKIFYVKYFEDKNLDTGEIKYYLAFYFELPYGAHPINVEYASKDEALNALYSLR